MKKITLKTLKIRNFKGIDRLDVDFADRVTSIYGRNASGKTTIADAFFWVLFDKDSAGRTDFNIKPLNSAGEVADHAATVEVEATIAVDGIEKVYKKTLAERWGTRRGCADKVFDGNETERFIDGLPMKKYEYDAAVNELANEQVFRTVTSTTYFSQTLTKTERRRILFDMTSNVTDGEMMAKDGMFAPLLPLLDKLGSVDNIKAAKTRERKAINEKRASIPVRVDELTRRAEALAGIDFSEIEKAAKEAEVNTEKAREKLAHVKNFSYPNEIDSDIIRLQAYLKTLEAENKEYKIANAAPDTWAIKAAAVSERTRLEAIEKNLDYIRDQMKRLRDEFNTVVKREILPEKACPMCGRDYDAESIEAAAGKLREARDAELDRINARGVEMKEQESKLAAEYEEQKKRCDAADAEAEKAAAIPEVGDMEGYAEKKAELHKLIDAKNAEKEKHRSDFAGMLTEAERELAECTAEEKRIKEELAKRGLIAECERRIEELKEEARTISAELEEIDAVLITLDEFVRFKVSVIEETINSLFGIVSFKLFNEQVNGALAECCEATVNGVPYADLNTAAKTNAGIDIINAVSEYYGICAPVFVDNAESVTELADGKAQVVRLVVSGNDERIRVA